MAITQLRAGGAHTGVRYGSFAGRGAAAEHPVDRLTQLHAGGAHTGGRYGSFAGRGAAGAHPVERLTQPGAAGAHTHGLYGSFAGRTGTASAHPVGRITQGRAFGAYTTLRYGDFTGRPPSPVAPDAPIGSSHGGGGERVRGRREEDETARIRHAWDAIEELRQADAALRGRELEQEAAQTVAEDAAVAVPGVAAAGLASALVEVQLPGGRTLGIDATTRAIVLPAGTTASMFSDDDMAAALLALCLLGFDD